MASIRGKVSFTAAESFWYVVGCIWFGGMYFAKVPVKKALGEMTQDPRPRYDAVRAGLGTSPQPGQPYQPGEWRDSQPEPSRVGPPVRPESHGRPGR